MTAIEAVNIVKSHFPDLTDDDAFNILWAQTPWPSFFQREPSVEEQIDDCLSRMKCEMLIGVFEYESSLKQYDWYCHLEEKYGENCFR